MDSEAVGVTVEVEAAIVVLVVLEKWVVEGKQIHMILK